MMINFDFLVAGCNTRCKHCYVNGGPGTLMPLEDALYCLEKMDALAEHLPAGTSFTLDHEPMNHPHVAKIIEAASKTKNISNFHHGMTTGIALMQRADKNEVVRTYMECGYDNFGITLHGNSTHHDVIVRRKGAFETAIAAAEYLKAMGAKINVSLMLNRHFVGAADELTRVIEHLSPNDIWFVTPIFIPHNNMLDFESHRATIQTVEAVRCYLEKWKQSEAEVFKKARGNTIAAAIEKLEQGIDLSKRFSQRQDELYMVIHQDCNLYIGNSGGEVQCLGDLRRLDIETTAHIINSIPGNRDYGAYYDFAYTPSCDELINALKKLPQNLLYGDFESVLYRGYAEMKIPTRIR